MNDTSAIADSLSSHISGYEFTFKLLWSITVGLLRGFWAAGILLSFFMYPIKIRRRLSFGTNLWLFTFSIFWNKKKFTERVVIDVIKNEENKFPALRRMLTEKDKGIGAVVPRCCTICGRLPSVRIQIKGLGRTNSAVVECHNCGYGYSLNVDFVTKIRSMRYLYFSVTSESVRDIMGFKGNSFHNELVALTTKIAIEAWDAGMRNIEPKIKPPSYDPNGFGQDLNGFGPALERISTNEMTMNIYTMGDWEKRNQ